MNTKTFNLFSAKPYLIFKIKFENLMENAFEKYCVFFHTLLIRPCCMLPFKEHLYSYLLEISGPLS
jgi:hypothetical protein